MVIYKKEQYNVLKENINVLSFLELSNASGIPLSRLYGIFQSLKVPLVGDAAKSFAIRNCEFLDPKQICCLTRIPLPEVYEILHSNGLCLDRVHSPRTHLRGKQKDKKRYGMFNVHERENWLI